MGIIPQWNFFYIVLLFKLSHSYFKNEILSQMPKVFRSCSSFILLTNLTSIFLSSISGQKCWVEKVKVGVLCWFYAVFLSNSLLSDVRFKSLLVLNVWIFFALFITFPVSRFASYNFLPSFSIGEFQFNLISVRFIVIMTHMWKMKSPVRWNSNWIALIKGKWKIPFDVFSLQCPCPQISSN